MLSIGITSHAKPSEYQLLEFPRPEITDPTDVLIKVHAASVNPVDLKKADGIFKMALKDSFPYKIGYDAAGTVAEIGAGVTRFKIGDAVYVRLPESHRGAWSEYAVCPERFIAQKPPSLSFEEAASMPLAATTAFQALKKYDGDLSGKTVFVPAGLGGTGLFACQLAKHVFHAGKVITTVSTSKVAKVPELLGEGTVDEIIDYKTSNPKTIIPHGTIDFLFDTTGAAMDYLCLMRPQTGCIVSIATAPSGTQLQDSAVMRLPHRPVLPVIPRVVLNVADSVRRVRAWRYRVRYEYMFLEPNGEDLEKLAGFVEGGKVRTVVGENVEMMDVEGVRKACQVVYGNQGGLGKAVIRVSAGGNL
ncbi:chaperonin 10-like protein [Aspergillus carlsbadensis]|nr:chaperonin 10-like protein [Aspergillus carlsbadensis]